MMKEISVYQPTNLPLRKANPVLIARQIASLREILRRMEASARAAALDPVINRKLEQLRNLN